MAALPRPEVTVASDGDVTEGSPALFTLTRTGDTAETLNVDYEVTASGDFGVTPGAGTATFPANSATVQVSVSTTGDTTDEADGSVTLTLQANPIAYALGADDTATVTVEDDDEAPLPVVTVAPRKSPVSEGDPAAEFVVTRTGDTTGALRVRLSVSETGDMVSAGNEGGQTRTLPAGQPSVVISVPTVDDGVHEADSVVTVTLEANAAYELGSDATAEVTVEDDDNAAPTGAVTIDDTTPVVGETLNGGRLRRRRPGRSDEPRASPGSGSGWRRAERRRGSAGATTASYTVVAGDVGVDAEGEGDLHRRRRRHRDPDERGDSGGRVAAAVAGAVDRRRERGRGRFGQRDAEPHGDAQPGGDGNRDRGVGDVRRHRNRRDGLHGREWNPDVQRIGDSSKTVSVTVAGDNVDEPNETFTVTLSNPSSSATIGDGTATGTITDDDATPTVTLVLSLELDHGGQ